jgi:hypothetical protein
VEIEVPWSHLKFMIPFRYIRSKHFSKQLNIQVWSSGERLELFIFSCHNLTVSEENAK